MARLQPATFSNQIGRKRKRSKSVNRDQANAVETNGEADDNVISSTTTTTVPTKVHDGGRKARRVNTHGGRPPLLNRNSSSNSIVTSDVPWPDHFKRLAQTHRALNLVFTFCCTRKHLATTFDNIKTAVESHIKRELRVEDVAQVKALVPRAINFAYVDEAMLQVHVLGTQDGVKNRRADAFQSTEQQQEDTHGRSRELLLFEFIDGDLKRQVQHSKTGEPTKPTRKLREEDLKMPVFSQKQMTTLINKRNTKFTSAVNAFLNQCSEDGVDPVMKIQEGAGTYIPMPTESRPTTPGPPTSTVSNVPSTIPEERKTISKIIDEIKATEWYTGQIVPDGHRVFDPQPPIYGELKFQLSQSLINALYNARNITNFYSHQAEAINNLYEGHHVIVSTSTSSGKSLIYQIPVLHELERDSNTRAMYIFPTKALAQDQRRSLKELLGYMEGLESIIVETFDGDTQMSDRNLIRDEGRIIFTNPDMLHITILPQEEAWRTFLKNLKFVVVDGGFLDSRVETREHTDSDRTSCVQWTLRLACCFYHETIKTDMCGGGKPPCEIHFLFCYCC